MSSPPGRGVGSARGRVLGATAVLVLSLACIGLGLSVLTAGDSAPGMAAMAGMTGSPTATVSAAAHGGAGVGSPGKAAATVGGSLQQSTSICKAACVDDMEQACTAAAAVVAPTLLALLIAFRRDTYLGLVARVRARPLRRHRPLRRPRTVPLPISLGVLRV